MSRRNFDFLSNEFLADINAIPDAQKPGFTAFAACIARAMLFSVLTILALYLIGFAVNDTAHFSNSQIAIFGLVFVFFEEQSRWIFASTADNAARASLVFLFLIVIVENVAFSIGNSSKPIDFAFFRAGSILVHAVNAWLCFISTDMSFRKKIATFAAALTLHFLMNIGGSEVLGKFLARVFSA